MGMDAQRGSMAHGRKRFDPSLLIAAQASRIDKVPGYL